MCGRQSKNSNLGQYLSYSGSLVRILTELSSVLIKSWSVLRRSMMCLGSPSWSWIEELEMRM